MKVINTQIKQMKINLMQDHNNSMLIMFHGLEEIIMIKVVLKNSNSLMNLRMLEGVMNVRFDTTMDKLIKHKTETRSLAKVDSLM